MRARARRYGGVSLIIAALLTSVAVPTTAHDDGCELELRRAPIEEAALIPSWVWREIEIAPGGWRGRVEWSGGDLRAASFAISCAADPASLFERRADVRRAVGHEGIELESIVGDEVAAWHDTMTATTHFEWRSGSTIGEVVGEWNASVGELAAIALALETARSSGEPPASRVDP